MMVAISISPAGTREDGGVPEAVAEPVRVVKEPDLLCELNWMFPLFEGE